MTGRPAHYPVSLVVAGRPVLVVGGGPVAGRKALGLAECGAVLTVVAPRVAATIEMLERDGRAAVERRSYRAGEAAAYRLVLTTTGDPAVDGAVFADADAAGVWVNCADDPARSSVLLPSVHRDGAVSVAVSTGGASPALAAWLRRRLADALGDHLGELADLMDGARRRVAAHGRPTASVDWAALLDGELPTLVADGRLEEAQRLLEDATR